MNPNFSLTPISESFMLNDDMEMGEMKINLFLSNPRNHHIKPFVENLKKATMPIIDNYSNIIGNCVAIAPKLALAPKHCIHGLSAYLGSFGTCEVIFDGTKSHNLDFTIIEIKEQSFNPIILDVNVNIGHSIQMYYKKDGLYIRSFKSDQGVFASRSNFSSSSTHPGESGAPRMSVTTGYVHAIHQGESEGLKINDIYIALKEAASNPQNSQQANAYKILTQIHPANLEMLYLSNSTLTLPYGGVDEEKKRINDVIKFDLDKNKFLFPYTEIGHGKGDRQIRIHKENTENSEVTYNIFPNPHKNKHYNKNQQEFYRILATSLSQFYLSNGAFPNESGTINALGTDYTLTPI